MRRGVLLGLGVVLLTVVGCGSSSQDEDLSKTPPVEVKTMEEIGKLSPEKEAQKLREQDSRPTEDRNEGGL